MEKGSGSFEALAEIGGGDVEIGSGFFSGSVFEVKAANGGLEIAGKLPDAFFDFFENGSICGQGISPGIEVDFEFNQVAVGYRLSILSPKPVFGFEADNAADPGTEVAFFFKLVEFLPGGNQCLLDDVAGGVAIASRSAGENEEVSMMFPHQAGEKLSPILQLQIGLGWGWRFHLPVYSKASPTLVTKSVRKGNFCWIGFWSSSESGQVRMLCLLFRHLPV